MNTHQPFIKIAFYSALYSTVLLTPVNATTAPTLNLFPTSVVANLQTSASSAEAMENNLEHIVVKMENQAQLYNDSQCEISPRYRWRLSLPKYSIRATISCPV